MFNDSDNGQTQHCEECLKWAEKYEKLKQQLEIDKNQINYFIEENERLKETEKEISDFISDISTCGFRYDYRSPDNLDELQQCIEDLCNKFDNYKHTLQEIKEITDARCDKCKYGKGGITCKFGDCGEAKLHLITQLITKAEEE